ncbi:tyrosine-type recombinase/integrase [Youxingia wuxianensis]|uniref:Tyrosine-type recombinase/integrase n=1 Tax=Youxingia wuxianensis TaxID=2763678 RepID=A0A926EUH0_9FIRM|nr:tyrosine-type recombinase/integrase [Youxingia wuxianensis]MBC8586569.1 tyrosine-type recombinase/integrase [Youxingia wuxianensis]
MKNPNHFGTITKLSGNRRRPYIVKEGISGRQKPIGYAATREEGLIMLASYNNDPWDIEADKITFQELYELWVEKRIGKLGKSNQNSLKAAYRHCTSLNKLKYRQIKSYQMQDCIDNCGRGYSTQGAIKNLLGHLDRFAMELDVVSKCCSDLLTSEPIPETSKEIFTDEEVSRLWENQNFPWVDSILFFLYTGFRISEMIDLKTEAVDLEAQVMTGGTKTAAGKNRNVPIHSKIQHIVQKRVKQSKTGYLFEYNGHKLSKTQYRVIWDEIMGTLKMNHTPHECRHTLRSRLDSAGANKVCIDRIMGHKSKETGERVYTHKNIEELKSNIELVTN